MSNVLKRLWDSADKKGTSNENIKKQIQMSWGLCPTQNRVRHLTFGNFMCQMA